jgi:hypothetical protein
VSAQACRVWSSSRPTSARRSAPAVGRHGRLAPVTDVLDGLDTFDWAALQAAYGAADDVPTLLRQLLDPSRRRRDAAVEQLYGTVWHQGTVYECTPLVVPFLAAVALNATCDDSTRAQVVLLLASIASATSFVLPQQPRRMWSPAWLREVGDEVPARDLTEDSRSAVAACRGALLDALPDAPPATQAALVAAVAAVAASPTAGDPATALGALAALRPFENDGDARLAAAARVVVLTAGQALTDHDLVELSAADGEAADYLTNIADWPVQVRAVELVRELVDRVVADRLR